MHNKQPTITTAIIVTKYFNYYNCCYNCDITEYSFYSPAFVITSKMMLLLFMLVLVQAVI